MFKYLSMCGGLAREQNIEETRGLANHHRQNLEDYEFFFSLENVQMVFAPGFFIEAHTVASFAMIA